MRLLKNLLLMVKLMIKDNDFRKLTSDLKSFYFLNEYEDLYDEEDLICKLNITG